MVKQLWSVFYFSLGIGVLLGLVIDGYLSLSNIGTVFTSFNTAITYLHLTAYETYLFAALIIGLVIALIIAVHRVYSTLSYSSEQIVYLIPLGFLGGLLLILGSAGILSILGVILLIIGMIIAYQVEKSPS